VSRMPARAVHEIAEIRMLVAHARDCRRVFVQLIGGLVVLEGAAESELSDHTPELEGDNIVRETFEPIV
jgi:hypothetical protein